VNSTLCQGNSERKSEGMIVLAREIGSYSLLDLYVGLNFTHNLVLAIPEKASWEMHVSMPHKIFSNALNRDLFEKSRIWEFLEINLRVPVFRGVSASESLTRTKLMKVICERKNTMNKKF
jgi:hypothetical protein